VNPQRIRPVTQARAIYDTGREYAAEGVEPNGAFLILPNVAREVQTAQELRDLQAWLDGLPPPSSPEESDARLRLAEALSLREIQFSPQLSMLPDELPSETAFAGTRSPSEEAFAAHHPRLAHVMFPDHEPNDAELAAFVQAHSWTTRFPINLFVFVFSVIALVLLTVVRLAFYILTLPLRLLAR
jgi:hypothetical protein